MRKLTKGATTLLALLELGPQLARRLSAHLAHVVVHAGQTCAAASTSVAHLRRLEHRSIASVGIVVVLVCRIIRAGRRARARKTSGQSFVTIAFRFHGTDTSSNLVLLLLLLLISAARSHRR